MAPLFPDFLESADSYDAAVAFWDRLVSDVERSLGQQDEWGRWIPLHYADGVTPMQKDGNPIFDGYSQALGRAFRIIQQPPESDGLEIAAWIKTYDLEGETTLLPASELVLNLSLSDESAEVARALLRSWMKPEITPSAMKTVIDASLLGHRDSET
jgi:hypothetical protein